MPVQTRVKNCTHIKVIGVRCGSPALGGEQFCAAHRQSPGLAPPLSPARKRGSHPGLPYGGRQWPDRGTIELRCGELILRALNTAVRNIRRVKFDLQPEKMVREVPPDPAPPEPKPTPAPTHESTASAAAADMAAVARPVHVGTAASPHRSGESCGDGRIPPSGGPEIPGRTAVAPSPTVKSPAARQAGVESPTIDPTHRKPPLSVKEVAAPKERKISAHSVSGG